MTTWIIIGIGALGLVASLYFSISEQRETAEELATATTQLEEQTAKAKAAVTVLAGERAAMNKMARRLEELEAKRDDLEDTVRNERVMREALEIENEQYKEWAGSRLPDAAIRLLDTSPFNPDNHPGALHERPSPDDTSVAPELERDKPERAPAGPDRSVRSEADDSQRPDSSD